MWFDIEFRWMMAIVLMLNGIAAIWVYYDAQRFVPRVNPTFWAMSCLLFSSGTLFLWWFRTGSHRSGLVFFIILTVAIILTGFNQEPIDQMISQQVSVSIQWAKENMELAKET